VSANADNSAVARNALTGYVAWMVGLAIGLVVTPVLLSRLGAEGFGAWTVVLTVTSYIGLVELGLGVATSRHLASALATGDSTRASAIAASARATYLALAGLGSIALVGVTTLSALRPDAFGITSDRVPFAVLLVGLGYLLSLTVMVYPVIAVGAGRVDLGVTVGIVSRVSVAAAQVVAVLISNSLVPLALVTGLGWIASTLAVRAVVRRHFADVDVRLVNAKRAIARALLASGWRNAAIVSTFAVAFQSDVLVVSAILGPIAVAGYGIAVRASMMIRALSTRATDVLVPTFAHTTALEDGRRTVNAFRESVFLARAISLPILIALIAFGEPLLRLWLGNVPADTNRVLVLLVLGIVIAAPGYSAYALLTGMDRLTYLLVGSSIAAAANLALSVFLTWKFGIIGPALGSLAAFTIWDMVILPRYIGSLLQIPWARLSVAGLRSLFAPCMAASAFAVAAVRGLGWATPTEGLLGACIVEMVFLAVLWPTLNTDRRARYRGLLSGATRRRTRSESSR
jgi:O-antigen/teichoic acid export membrane protein